MVSVVFAGPSSAGRLHGQPTSSATGRFVIASISRIQGSRLGGLMRVAGIWYCARGGRDQAGVS